MLQAQGDGAASGRLPGQGGGLADSEGVATGGDVEGVGIATGGSDSRKCGDSKADESAHRDSKDTECGFEMKRGHGLVKGVEGFKKQY